MKQILLIFVTFLTLFACKKESVKSSQSANNTVVQQSLYIGKYYTPSAVQSQQGDVRMVYIWESNSQYYMTTPFASGNGDTIVISISNNTLIMTPKSNGGCITQGNGTIRNDSIKLNWSYSCPQTNYNSLYVKQ